MPCVTSARLLLPRWRSTKGKEQYPYTEGVQRFCAHPIFIETFKFCSTAAPRQASLPLLREQAVCHFRAIVLDAEEKVVGDFFDGLCCCFLCHSVLDLSGCLILQIYHFYRGKANNLTIVYGVLKSFCIFAVLFRKIGSSPQGKVLSG